MRYLLVLKKHLQKELKNLEKTIRETKIARDNSPSAMESASDESRSRLEGAVSMFQRMKKEKEDLLGIIPVKSIVGKNISVWSFAEIELSDKRMSIAIVPDGLGGIKVEEFQYVSDNTPLGKALIGKSRGDNFSFNDSTGTVISVNE